MRPTDLETVSGKIIDLENPDPEKICINDIAWALSRIVRYNGHTVQRIPYTVGQHSIVVSSMAREAATKAGASELDIETISIIGLLHDAAEAYTGDISGPLKKIQSLRPIIKSIEHEIEDVIIEALQIPNTTTLAQYLPLIKKADVHAQAVEAYNFMFSRGKTWEIDDLPEISLVEYQNFEMPKPSIEIYHEFLKQYHQFRTNIDALK